MRPRLTSRLSLRPSGAAFQVSRSRSSPAARSTIRSSFPSSRVAARFRVVTDSTSDVSPAWRERYRIEVVPVRVLFGSDAYRDGVDMSTAEFFTRLARADRLPTTSAPSPGDFAAVYDRLSRECDGVVSIHISGELSGTVEAARVGARSVQ